ncbi:hypothetical protein J7W08_09280 [Methanococcoides orientis]|uniref:hypothetical protein n=1 Tax=Methanococcoides orientis TaxID=2822137 RepID=UPI001E30CFB0|nr:hypothetical protein [Methanococcoides orientis]UGV40266.1 hypothetical protein J7W08_09280 [Methanococcoides orientis]
MQRKAGKALGITGGLLAIIAGAYMFAVTVGGLQIGGGVMMYGVSSVFGISDPELIMSAFCLMIMLFGAMGIAGGIYAEKDQQLAGILMIIPAIFGFVLLSVIWAPVAAMLIPGGILTIRSGK